ncbi:MAG: LTA synthase family protein [Bacilli bacterium]|nr:LTA synthase family protein [Bacilli bacterium]
MNRNSLIKYILTYIFVFLLSLAVTSTSWAINKFAFITFDETLFQLTTPIKSAESSIITTYLTDSFLVALLVSIVIFVIIVFITKKLKKKHSSKKINTITVTILVIIATIIIYVCLDKIGFVKYTKNQFRESNFIKENYVDPNKVKVTFPEQKRNLIYIYVESLESTYFSKDLGGESKDNLLKPITDITKNNINFSDTNKFGGAMTITGTTWTTGAMIAQTAGLPLKLNSFKVNTEESSMMSGAVTLGDILKENGYKQMYMIGSDKNFGHRGPYFEKHGNYEIFDYNTAKEQGKIDEDYYVWWGYEDSKLFEYAKEEITNLASSDQPFNFTMLTANTHFTDGYLEKDCPKKYKSAYYNSVYCSANQIKDFIKWIEKQPFYENTTIIIAGDHVSMQAGAYPGKAKRRIYNLFINSAVTEGRIKNRDFCTMDMYPTTLASLGAKIEGDRLALGTNLFSNRKTLIEEKGYKTFEREVSKHSNFYINNISKKK